MSLGKGVLAVMVTVSVGLIASCGKGGGGGHTDFVDPGTGLPDADYGDGPGSHATVDDSGNGTPGDAQFGGDSPKIDPAPSGTAPLAFCTADTLTLNTMNVLPGPDTPRPFVGAWTAQAKKISGGPMLFRLSGLTSNPLDATFAIGSQDGNTPPSFSKFAEGPATDKAIIVAPSRQVTAGSLTAKFAVRFSGSSGALDIPVIGYQLGGFLDPTCTRLDRVSLTLYIPQSAGSIVFDGVSTLADLLAEPDAKLGSERAWVVVFGGSALPAGG